MGRSREDIEFVADLKLKLLLLSDVSVVGCEWLLGLRDRGKQERQEGDNNLECADLPLLSGEGWGEEAKLSG